MRILKLEECCEIITDGVHNTPPLVDKGIPLLDGNNIRDLKIDDSNPKKYISKETDILISKRCKPKEQDVLVSSRGSIGKVAIVSKGQDFNIMGNMVLVRREKQLLQEKYLAYYFLSQRAYINNIARGVAQKGLYLKDVRRLKIPLPPLPIQKKIAAILDTADALKQKDKALIAKYNELTQSLFLDMFGDPVINPKEWEKTQIDKLCSTIVDCVNRTAPCVDYETPYKMIRTTNIRNYKMDTKNVKFVTEDIYNKWTRRLQPLVGDIIFTREAPVGEAAIIETKEKIFLGQRTMEYRFDRKKANPYFMLYEIMGSNIQRQIHKLGSGSTVKHLSVPDCKKFVVNLPPIELQNQFAERVKIIEQQKQLTEQSLKKSEDLFNCLLQKAFKGELVS